MSKHISLYTQFFALIGVLLMSSAVQAAIPGGKTTGKVATAYLPSDTQFDPSIMTPEAYLGNPVGKWHVRHDQLLGYMHYLADASDRVSLIETGKTHEDRQLVLLTITTPEKHKSLDDLRNAHIDAIQTGTHSAKDSPLFIYMGYSVHGNEPSGSNAALLVGYYLAAGNDARISKLLNESVVLLDPSLNPDGLSRFAQWANMHKGKTLSAYSEHREHREGWPSGRTNHYWFDLNRDWLLLTHPESKARINQFHQWRPHVLTDFHEMGTNSTYFFQPGIPSRKNPLTPDENVTLTQALAKFHAKALDNDGQLYFTEESFDDFYFGKGSTYPDAHGSVGILFEQASSRGHLQESINGELAFDQTIQNQITTSLSTFDGAIANKPALLDYQVRFFEQTQTLIKEDDSAGIVITANADKARFNAMLDKLDMHKIQFSVVTKSTTLDDLDVQANHAVFVPFDQPQYRLTKSLFSERTYFVDNTFYDVSNWNMPVAFDLNYRAVSSRQARQLSLDNNRQALALVEPATSAQNAVAYAFDWHHYMAPALAQKLLEHNLALRVANKSFSANTGESVRDFAPGTVLLPLALNASQETVANAMSLAKSMGIPMWPITSGLTPKGIDLGSRNMAPMKAPAILLLGGQGTSQYEVGEIWHYLDTRVGAPVALVELSRLARVDLSKFTHIIAASGRYNSISDETEAAITNWVQAGGTLIGQKTALRWFKREKWLDISIVDSAKIDALFATDGLQFGDREALSAKKRISGAAFNTSVDVTHPLFYGVEDSDVPFFKTTNIIVEHTENPFDTLATYTDSPLLGGYTAPELVQQVRGSAAVVVQTKGKGRVVGFVDNVNFRGYWYGTSKLMGNALFMSELMD